MTTKLDIFDAIAMGSDGLRDISFRTMSRVVLSEALFEAVDLQNVPAVEIMLSRGSLWKQGAEPHSPQRILEHAVYNPHCLGDCVRVACENGNRAIFHLLMDSNFDVGLDDSHAFRRSVANNNVDFAETLLLKGADVNASNGYPIYISSAKSYTGMVELLIDHGADVHTMDDRPLREASKRGHLSVVSRLVLSGAKVDALGNYALYWAHRNGHHEVAELLVENGATLTQQLNREV